jgi:hypothetical protein
LITKRARSSKRLDGWTADQIEGRLKLLVARLIISAASYYPARSDADPNS